MQFASRLGRIFNVDGVLLGVLFASLALNVFLGVTRSQPVPARPDLLPTGAKAAAFEGVSPEGKTVRLDYASDRRDTLLYVFSPTCHWCDRNLENVRAIVKARPDLHIVGVNIGPSMSPQERASEPFTEIVRPSQATVIAYHLSGTPTTFLISPDGKIAGNWSGAYGGATASDISKVLAVTLPGLIKQ